MFSGFTNVDEFIVRGFDYSFISTAVNMFDGLGSADAVKILELGDLNFANVTEPMFISDMFKNVNVSELNLRTLSFGPYDSSMLDPNFISTTASEILVSINRVNMPGNNQTGTGALTLYSNKDGHSIELKTNLNYTSIIDSGDIRIFSCVKRE